MPVVLDLIDLTGVLVTAGATVALFVVARSQLGQLDRNMDLQLYADYTKRYQKLILRLPTGVVDGSTGLTRAISDAGPAGDEILRYLRVYFDLCYEEWFLFHRRKGIDQETWDDWREGIAATMRSGAFCEAWQKHYAGSFDEEFRRFMSDMIESREPS